MRTALFSIISPNYRHFARVLMDSVRQHHPEWDRHVLVVGETEPVPEPLFESHSLDALQLPDPRAFCFRYTLLELNTAVKPWMFGHLFARGYDRVIYLDPDILIYSPLAELENDAFLTLTPHLTGFIGGDLDHPSERTVLLAGAYNLGFLAVTRKPALAPFLDWWKDKLEFQCVVATERGLFVDQKWIDLAPGLFDDVAILRHDGYNVAYWNLGQRRVTGRTVNDQPLRFFHFSGFDPAFPNMVSKHDHRRRLTDIGDARALIDDYSAALHAAGYGEELRGARYAYGFFDDGTPIPDAAREAYRNSPELQAKCGADPFAHPELFTSIRDTRGVVPSPMRIASYKLLSRARPIVRLFPRSVRTSMRELFLGRRERSRTPDATLEAGLNVVGYVGRDTGVAESARLCIKSCDAAGLPRHVIDIDARDRFAERAVCRASIFHVNADMTPAMENHFPHILDASSYNIGVWHWELPELPDAWIESAAPLDEIWAPSAFVQSAVSRKVSIPVVHMPHGIAVTEIEECIPEELGVPAGSFVFLCMFDFDSVVQRKNPLGAAEAFRRAFGDDPRASLLIKAAHASTHAAEYAELQERLRGMSNVYLVDRMLPRARVNGLVAACDGVLSLHRAEGFGLTLAEAMQLGKPVVATAWSGNVDFMNGGNSYPVAYELVTLERTFHCYEAGQQWAEPDLEHAARLLREVVDDDAGRARVAARARETMRDSFSPRAAGERYRRRLKILGLMN